MSIKICKRGLAAVLALLLALSLAACSGDGSSALSSGPAGSAAPLYASAEEFAQSDRIQQQMKTFRENLSDDMQAEISGEGNRLTYTFQYGDLGDFDRDTLIVALKRAAESMASSFTENAVELGEGLGINDPVVEVVYLDDKGEVLYSREYTPKQ